jgi:chemotaxis protein histidine kinase CheA
VRALLLPVGAERYAVELTAVREVLVAPAPTPLPGAPPTVLGVVNLRGEVVPVLDTAALLGAERQGRAAFAAMVDTDAGPAALAADAQPATAVLDRPVGAAELPAAAGRFAVGDGVVALLDLGALLSPERIGGS